MSDERRRPLQLSEEARAYLVEVLASWIKLVVERQRRDEQDRSSGAVRDDVA